MRYEENQYSGEESLLIGIVVEEFRNLIKQSDQHEIDVFVDNVVANINSKNYDCLNNLTIACNMLFKLYH